MPSYLELAYNGNYVGKSAAYSMSDPADIFTYKGKVYMAFVGSVNSTVVGDVIELHIASGLFIN